MERQYEGCQIEVTSYPSGRQWRPIVIVSKKTGACREITNLRTPSDWLFNTKQEADKQGHQLGSARSGGRTEGGQHVDWGRLRHAPRTSR
jgi:hypothetical protein